MPQPLTRIMLASLLVEQDAVPVTLRVKQDGQWSAVPADAITVADLRTWPAGAPPDGARVLLDPELGRMVLAGTREAVAVDHASGAAWAIGGGGYGRADRLVLPDPTTWIARIGGDMKVPPERREDGRHCFASLVEALGACPGWATDVLIEIADNRIHLLTAPEGDSRVRGVLDGSAPDSLVLLCGGRHVVLQAMDGFRPCIDGSLILDTRDKPGGLVVSGVWWRGGLTLRGEATLMLVDSTVWPQDGPAVTSDPQAAGQQSVLVAHSITGALRLRALSSTLRISASIVDGRGAAAVAGNATGGGAFGPAPALDCATLIGDLVTSAMPDGGDSLVTGAIVTRQGRTPPPAMVSFRSRRFGHPAYAVLADDCPAAISRGASDGGELGAFHVCQNRSRIECLARVIDDYLPEGLSGQFHFVT
jgi:hypothetical protein